MNTATLLLSFDCESKWGLLDCLTRQSNELIHNQSVLSVYENLGKLTDSYNLKSNYACTIAMLLSQKDFMIYFDRYLSKNDQLKDWLKPYFYDSYSYKYSSGWHIPDLIPFILNTNVEISAHGFVHCPVLAGISARKAFELELLAIKKFTHDMNLPIRSYVYPKNIINHPDLLAKFGVSSYRDCLNMMRLSELNILSKSQELEMQPIDNVFKIPPGYFINWKHGLRKYIPAALTVKRAKNIIDCAIEHSNVAHFWAHPHNFITAPETFNTLEAILSYAHLKVQEGLIDSLTFTDYQQRIIKSYGN